MNGQTMALAAVKPDRSFAVLEQAESQLASIEDVGELKQGMDKLETIRQYAKKIGGGLEIQQRAATAKLRYERKAGEVLEGMNLPNGRPAKRSHDVTVLSDLGIEKMQSHRWQLIASLPESLFESHIESALESGREITSAAVIKLAKQTRAQGNSDPQPRTQDRSDNLQHFIDSGTKYATIYADPPWQYGNQATRASTDNHYQTMTVDEICALPIAELAADNAHLHLWTTNAFLFDAKRVIEAWGFEYKSCRVWVKPQMGIGNYWRVSHEFLLLGVRGDCPFLDKSMMSWLEASRGEHSAKPYAFRRDIERVSPGPYIELFARQTAKDWSSWGNQIEGSMYE